MRVKIYTSLDKLMKLRPIWEELYQASQTDNPFLSWEWNVTWWRHFGRDTLCVVLVEDSTGPVAVAPLAVHPSGILPAGRPVVTFLSDGPLKPDYMDILGPASGVTDTVPAIVGALQRHLREMPQLKLDGFPGVTPALNELEKILRTRDILVEVIEISKSPFIDTTSGDWESYFASVSKSLRQDLRTSRNRLNREGLVETIERHTELGSDNRVLYQFAEVYQQRQRYRARVGAVHKGTLPFLRELCHLFGQRGWLDVAFLKLNGEVAASALDVRSSRTYYWWLTAFSPKYARYSPGKLLLEHLIRNAFETSVQRFDFMLGMEQYKLQWTDRAIPNLRLISYPHAWAQRLDHTKRRLRLLAQQARYRSSLVNKLWIRISKYLG